MANGNTPWGDEQAAIDEYGAGTTTVAPEATPGMVQIGADRWRENVAGPVPLDGQGILMKGGTPSPLSGPAPLTEQYFREREQFLEQQRQRAYIADLMAQAGPVNANQAIEKAMRMEGVLGFEADRKAGMPLMEAMSKHAGKMFYNNPSGMIQMARLEQQNQALKQAASFTPREITLPSGATVREMSRGRFANVPQVSPPGTPTEASPIIDPVTKQVLGHMVRTPEGRYHPVTPQREDTLTIQDKIGIIRMQLEQIKAEINAAALLGANERKKKMEELGKERQGLYDQLKALGVPTVKEKETGQTHFYTGSLDELPDTHELIDQAAEGKEEGQV